MIEKNVLAMATADTYEIVTQYLIHAYPTGFPYPKPREYFIPIRKKGVMEYLYKVTKTIEFLPNEIYNCREMLTQDQYNRLIAYHETRERGFRYGSREKKYHFCILEKIGDIEQPFVKKNVQVSFGLSLIDVPLQEKIKTPKKKAEAKKAAEPKVELFVEYQGQAQKVDDLVAYAKCQTANCGRRFRRIIFGEFSDRTAISSRRMRAVSGDMADFQRRQEKDSRPYFSRGSSSFEIRPRGSRSLV